MKNVTTYGITCGSVTDSVNITVLDNGAVPVVKPISSGIRLVLGSTYEFAGYDWDCVEELSGGYVLQSHKITKVTLNGTQIIIK